MTSFMVTAKSIIDQFKNDYIQSDRMENKILKNTKIDYTKKCKYERAMNTIP